MAINCGGPISEVYFGAEPISEVYFGADLVWRKIQPVSTDVLREWASLDFIDVPATAEGGSSLVITSEKTDFTFDTLFVGLFIADGGELTISYPGWAASSYPNSWKTTISRTGNVCTVSAFNVFSVEKIRYTANVPADKYAFCYVTSLAYGVDYFSVKRKQQIGEAPMLVLCKNQNDTYWGKCHIDANDAVLHPRYKLLPKIGGGYAENITKPTLDTLVPLRKLVVEDHCTVPSHSKDIVRAMGRNGYPNIWDLAAPPTTSMGDSLQLYDFSCWVGPGGDLLLTDRNKADDSDWPCRIWSTEKEINVGSGDYQIAWKKTLRDAKWHHIYLSVDSTRAKTRAQIWCDGAYAWTGELPGNHTARPKFNPNAVKVVGPAGYWIVLEKDTAYRSMILEDAAR